MDYTDSIISKVGFIGSKVKIRVLIMDCKVRFLIVLVKLFLKRYLIYPELNSPLITIYSLILYSVYSIKSSSYKVLNNNLETVVFLYFFTYILLVHRSI